MSSPSKKRKKAREWMQREVEERKKIEIRARHQGQEDIRRDGQKLLPQKVRTLTNERGGIDVSAVIPSFPDPYGNVPHFSVPFPQGALSGRFGARVMLSERVSLLHFRPVEHAFKQRIEDNNVELRWFTWEPDRGNAEIEQHTQALFQGMGKLGFVARTLEMISQDWAPRATTCSNCGQHSQQHTYYPELQRAAELLKECSDEMRLRLGKFAPEPDMSEREQQMRYGHRRDFSGRPL